MDNELYSLSNISLTPTPHRTQSTIIANSTNVIIEEKDLTGEKLLEEINKLIGDREKLNEIGSNAKKMATLNAKETIADIVK